MPRRLLITRFPYVPLQSPTSAAQLCAACPGLTEYIPALASSIFPSDLSALFCVTLSIMATSLPSQGLPLDNRSDALKIPIITLITFSSIFVLLRLGVSFRNRNFFLLTDHLLWTGHVSAQRIPGVTSESNQRRYWPSPVPLTVIKWPTLVAAGTCGILSSKTRRI
jgi:hypothetical protein